MRTTTALTALLLVVLPGCGGGDETVTSQPASTTSSPVSGKATLERAVRIALGRNRRLSIFVLWNNRIPAWAVQTTRGPALASLRAAARDRARRGIRVRVTQSKREILSLRLDPSFTRATAVVRDRQRVQPAGRGGVAVGRATELNERARYELRRVGRLNRFVVWRVVLLT